MRIFVNVGASLREGFFSAETLRRMQSMGEVRFCPEHPLGGDALCRELKDTDLLLTGWGQPTLHAADLGDVKLWAHTGGTVGGIAAEDVFDAGIPVLSGNRYYAESVAEGVIAYMLFALRDMGQNAALTKAGGWPENRTRGLLDKKVGIVSVGAVSRLVIEWLARFRCETLVYSTRPDPDYAARMGIRYASLDEIFSTCDVVSVHTARTPQTHHMIGAHHFALLRPGAVFLNTARGEVIDEEALLEALKDNRFSAVLDVYQKEPLPADHPFHTLPNITLFPHQCGPTYDRRDYITGRLLDDAERFFRGEKPENEITKEVAARMTH